MRTNGVPNFRTLQQCPLINVQNGQSNPEIQSASRSAAPAGNRIGGQ